MFYDWGNAGWQIYTIYQFSTMPEINLTSEKNNEIINRDYFLHSVVIANIVNKERPVDLALICEAGDDLFIIPFYRILGQVKFSDDAMYYPAQLADRLVLLDIVKSRYGLKKQDLKNKIDNEVIAWSSGNDGKSVYFTCMNKGEKRELRVDEIFFNVNKQAIYWKCFCFTRKSTRTFKDDSLKAPFFIDDKEYSKEEFFNQVLGISYDDIKQISIPQK